MKVLYLPLNSLEVKQTGMIDAFTEYGADLSVFDYNVRYVQKEPIVKLRHELIKLAKRIQPDLMHMQLQFTTTIDPDTIREIRRVSPKTIITNWTGDVRVDVPSAFIHTANVVDLSLISSVGQLQMYRQAIGADKVKYWQIGFNPKLYYPMEKPAFAYNASFAASNYTTSQFPGHLQRKKTVTLLHAEFGPRFGLFGYGWKKYNAKYVSQTKINEIYNKSATCISVSNFNNLSHYFSDRLLMCLASGRPTICLTFPGWQSYFTNMYDIVIANTPEEIPAKVKMLIKNPELSNNIGRQGAITAFSEHTYFSRVKELFYLTGLS